MSEISSYICPSCLTATTLEIRVTKPRGPNDHIRYDICECNNCKQHFLVEKMFNSGVILQIYPSVIAKAAPDDLPLSIKLDFEESLKNESISCYRSSVVMARRALQGICLDQGAPEHTIINLKNGKQKKVPNSLSSQIDWLLKEQIITKPLCAMAHEVRTVGNSGAHPEDALDKKEVTKKDASEILALLEAFAQTLYIAPSLLSSRLNPTRNELS